MLLMKSIQEDLGEGPYSVPAMPAVHICQLDLCEACSCKCVQLGMCVIT